MTPQDGQAHSPLKGRLGINPQACDPVAGDGPSPGPGVLQLCSCPVGPRAEGVQSLGPPLHLAVPGSFPGMTRAEELEGPKAVPGTVSSLTLMSAFPPFSLVLPDRIISGMPKTLGMGRGGQGGGRCGACRTPEGPVGCPGPELDAQGWLPSST